MWSPRAARELPASCTGQSKWALGVIREWANERVQWGQPIGRHDAIAQKIAFVAATTYALDAVLEMSSALADDKRNDMRIEAALAKLWSWRWAGSSPTSSSISAAGAATRPPPAWPPAGRSRSPSSRTCATCGSTASSRDRARSCACSSPARRWTSTSASPAR
ncbi:MAG: acyl-CoA dehydrogenase family protein [Frankiaceae bacterium]